MDQNISFQDELIGEWNRIRLNPKTYARKLRSYIQYIDKDNILRLPNSNTGIITNGGAKVFEEAATYCDGIFKIPPLQPNNALSHTALAWVSEMSKVSNMDKMNTIDREGLMGKFGHYEGSFGESVDFGSDTIELILMNLLVDDSDPQRRNRAMMFSEKYHKIGCATSPHNSFRCCTVIMYATNFIPNGRIGECKQGKLEAVDPISRVGNAGSEQPRAKHQNINQGGEGNLEEDFSPKAHIQRGRKDKGREIINEREEREVQFHKNVDVDEDMTLPPGVWRIERKEKIIFENGVKKKIVKLTNYMEDGGVNTEIFKEPA